MDALSDVLRVVQLSGAVYLNAEFTAPWCLVGKAESDLCAAYLPRANRVISYHLITRGSCWARLEEDDDDEQAPIQVSAGDLLVVPQGERHLMGSNLALKPTPSAQVLSEHVAMQPGEVMHLRYGGGGASTGMVCGFLVCDEGQSNSLLASLPRIFKVNLGEGREQVWLATALGFAAAEAAEPKAGSATVLAKLSELLFVEAVRRYIDTLPDNEKGWLAAVRDRYVGRALSRLHAQPAHPWTVEELASHAGLSRSSLAQRFTNLLGLPPMQYLARLRLHLAARLMRGDSKPLVELASRVGYDSEAAFSRAFKREFGLPPASWRTRQAQQASSAQATLAPPIKRDAGDVQAFARRQS